MVWLIVLIVLGFFLLILYFKKIKHLKTTSVNFINGGVKSGKTTLCLALAYKQYRKELRAYKFKNFFRKLFKKEPLEEPLFYSNIPVVLPKNEKVCLLTSDLINRKKRFRFHSVIFISESSFVFPSEDYKDKVTSESLKDFVKLIAHETHKGSMYIETQAIADIHNSVKKCIDKYFWINSCHKCLILPFIFFDVRDLAYSYDNTNVTNIFSEDTDKDHRYLIISKRIWKCFDCICYRKITDNLPVEDTIAKFNKNDLSTDEIVTNKGVRKK